MVFLTLTDEASLPGCQVLATALRNAGVNVAQELDATRKLGKQVAGAIKAGFYKAILFYGPSEQEAGYVGVRRVSAEPQETVNATTMPALLKAIQ